MKYIVELDKNVWLAAWSGDPGRTLCKGNARIYKSYHEATVALGMARKYRPFKNAECIRISLD